MIASLLVKQGLYPLSGTTSHRQNLVKSRNREIVCYIDRSALKSDWHFGRNAAVVPVEFQSDWIGLQ